MTHNLINNNWQGNDNITQRKNLPVGAAETFEK